MHGPISDDESRSHSMYLSGEKYERIKNFYTLTEHPKVHFNNTR